MPGYDVALDRAIGEFFSGRFPSFFRVYVLSAGSRYFATELERGVKSLAGALRFESKVCQIAGTLINTLFMPEVQSA